MGSSRGPRLPIGSSRLQRRAPTGHRSPDELITRRVSAGRAKVHRPLGIRVGAPRTPGGPLTGRALFDVLEEPLSPGHGELSPRRFGQVPQDQRPVAPPQSARVRLRAARAQPGMSWAVGSASINVSDHGLSSEVGRRVEGPFRFCAVQPAACDRERLDHEPSVALRHKPRFRIKPRAKVGRVGIYVLQRPAH